MTVRLASYHIEATEEVVQALRVLDQRLSPEHHAPGQGSHDTLIGELLAQIPSPDAMQQNPDASLTVPVLQGALEHVLWAITTVARECDDKETRTTLRHAWRELKSARKERATCCA